MVNFGLWLVFGLIIALAIIAIILIKYRQKLGLKQETDYRTFFRIGIVWTVLGIIPGNSFFFM